MNDWSSYQVDTTSKHEPSASKIEPGQGLGRGKGRAPRYDRGLILASWRRTGSVTQVMKEIGCSEMTARRALNSMGVEFESKGGRPRPEKCKEGHDQAEWGRKTKKGWHYCGKCHSIRNQEYKKRKAQQ